MIWGYHYFWKHPYKLLYKSSKVKVAYTDTANPTHRTPNFVCPHLHLHTHQALQGLWNLRTSAAPVGNAMAVGIFGKKPGKDPKISYLHLILKFICLWRISSTPTAILGICTESLFWHLLISCTLVGWGTQSLWRRYINIDYVYVYIYIHICS